MTLLCSKSLRPAADPAARIQNNLPRQQVAGLLVKPQHSHKQHQHTTTIYGKDNMQQSQLSTKQNQPTASVEEGISSTLQQWQGNMVELLAPFLGAFGRQQQHLCENICPWKFYTTDTPCTQLHCYMLQIHLSRLHAAVGQSTAYRSAVLCAACLWCQLYSPPFLPHPQHRSLPGS